MTSAKFKNRVFLAPAELTTAQRQLLINIFTNPPASEVGMSTSLSDIATSCKEIVEHLRNSLPTDEEYDDEDDATWWMAYDLAMKDLREGRQALEETIDRGRKHVRELLADTPELTKTGPNLYSLEDTP